MSCASRPRMPPLRLISSMASRAPATSASASCLKDPGERLDHADLYRRVFASPDRKRRRDRARGPCQAGFEHGAAANSTCVRPRCFQRHWPQVVGSEPVGYRSNISGLGSRRQGRRLTAPKERSDGQSPWLRPRLAHLDQRARSRRKALLLSGTGGSRTIRVFQCSSIRASSESSARILLPCSKASSGETDGRRSGGTASMTFITTIRPRTRCWGLPAAGRASCSAVRTDAR